MKHGNTRPVRKILVRYGKEYDQTESVEVGMGIGIA
jgi:hypothetical protein